MTSRCPNLRPVCAPLSALAALIAFSATAGTEVSLPAEALRGETRGLTLRMAAPPTVQDHERVLRIKRIHPHAVQFTLHTVGGANYRLERSLTNSASL